MNAIHNEATNSLLTRVVCASTTVHGIPDDKTRPSFASGSSKECFNTYNASVISNRFKVPYSSWERFVAVAIISCYHDQVLTANAF